MSIKIFALAVLIYVVNSFKLFPLNFNHSSLPKDIPDKLYAAEIHYSRVPHQYWEHRLKSIKAMGFNALSVYVMWNFHQIEKGKFQFQKQDRNLKLFLELSKKQGFYVLLRPGPYICSEWDFGGLPVRLMSNKNLSIRSNNKDFLDEVKSYFTAIAPVIKQHSLQKNGSIILLQIQNEYGQFGSDKKYIQALRNIWNDLNVTVTHYCVDAFSTIDRTYWDGAVIGLNGIMAESYYQDARKQYPQNYIFGGQIYSGWHTHWGQNWYGKSSAQFQFEFNFLMSYDHSFSMYMAFGGTNFGLWAGANTDRRGQSTYWPVLTSYDYDAPINEQGAPTEKFYVFRDMVKKYSNWQIPDLPQSVPTMQIPAFTPVTYADLFENLPQAKLKQVQQPVTFQDQRLQMFNQGFVLYETVLEKGLYVINISVSDYALVYQDGRYIRHLDRSQNNWHIMNVLAQNDNSKLQILVEAMGHINFSPQMVSDYKGITKFVAWKFPVNNLQFEKCKSNPSECKAQTLLWDIYPIPIDNKMLRWNKVSDQNSFPRLFGYTLNLNKTDDTFLNMENWGKGYVFVNGKNLGRYWQKGPQKRLYLPGVWLKKGDNEIIVMDLLNGVPFSMKGQLTLRSPNQPIQDATGKYFQKINKGFSSK